MSSALVERLGTSAIVPPGCAPHVSEPLREKDLGPARTVRLLTYESGCPRPTHYWHRCPSPTRPPVPMRDSDQHRLRRNPRRLAARHPCPEEHCADARAPAGARRHRRRRSGIHLHVQRLTRRRSRGERNGIVRLPSRTRVGDDQNAAGADVRTQDASGGGGGSGVAAVAMVGSWTSPPSSRPTPREESRTDACTSGRPS